MVYLFPIASNALHVTVLLLQQNCCTY